MKLSFEEAVAAVMQKIASDGMHMNTAKGDIRFADHQNRSNDFAVDVIESGKDGQPVIMDFGRFNPHNEEFERLGRLTNGMGVFVQSGSTAQNLDKLVRIVGRQLGMQNL